MVDLELKMCGVDVALPNYENFKAIMSKNRGSKLSSETLRRLRLCGFVLTPKGDVEVET